jgi:hypothetical protein
VQLYLPNVIRTKILIAAVASLCACGLAYAQQSCPKDEAEVFRIDLIRLGTDTVLDKSGLKTDRIFGDIGVNNANIGRFYENPATKIELGTYKGLLRYRSDHNFVQSACGAMFVQGDFLLEIAGVTDENGNSRNGILIHPGALPSNSAGCILAGARQRDSNGNLLPLTSDSPLVKLRTLFYGSANPVACPNKQIIVHVGDK